MTSFGYRLSVFATLCALVGGFLVIVDLAETPWVFENWPIEVAFFAPLVVWLVGRRLHLWPRNGPV